MSIASTKELVPQGLSGAQNCQDRLLVGYVFVAVEAGSHASFPQCILHRSHVRSVDDTMLKQFGGILRFDNQNEQAQGVFFHSCYSGTNAVVFRGTQHIHFVRLA